MALKAPELSGSRILIIEDDEDLRGDLAAALGLEGYQVQACALGLQAVEVASQQEFDLVVSDIRMAGMDGLETLERLQQAQPSVATLVITGYTAEADSIRAVRLGVGDYLKKPFRLDEFLAAVARQLSLHRVRKLRDQREQNLGRTALWSLESWLAQLNLVDSALAGRRALAMARHLGLAPEVALQAQLTVLVGAARAALPLLEVQALPADLLAALEEMRSEDLEELSLVARVAQLAACQQAPPGDSPLAQAWREAQVRPTAGPDSSREKERQRRNQWWMARSLEQSGQPQAAVALYQELLQGSTVDRVQVEACLALMRLSLADVSRCRHYALEATRLAAQLQPLLLAVTTLEAGLFLAQCGARAQAIESFEQALQLTTQLGQPLLRAKATLALLGADPARNLELAPALQRLLDPADRYELIDSAWWLIPCLLRLQVTSPQPLQERILAILGRDAPGVFVRLLAANRLEAPARQAAVVALAESVQPAAQQCLRQLASDQDPAVRRAAESALRGSDSKPVPPTLRIYTLGGFEVWRGEERIPDGAFRSWKQRFLLARLAGSARPLPAEKLTDEFWPDDAEGGRASLNVVVSHMRKLLRPPNWPEELDYLPRDASGVKLSADLPLWHDLNEFVSAAEATELGRWQQAVELYRGPYFENCYLEWAVAQRSRAENLMLSTLHRLIEALTAQERHQEVLVYTDRLLELDACSQEGHLGAMRAHLQLGRPEAALRQFDKCKRIWASELGAEPSIALLELRQRVLLTL